MGEKLLIIAEKPDTRRSFASALGGNTGTFNDDQYAIVNLFGHILGNGDPAETALPQYKDTVGKFSNLSGIPWSYTWFDFDKKKNIAGDGGARVLRDIQSYLNQGYIPVIASDVDESGEGDLLVREVLVFLNYHGKTYREYHIDYSKKELIKALNNKKIVDENDIAYKLARTRSNMDYLTQQLTRVATMTIQNKGYKLPSAVPVGRLKSSIIRFLGDQLIAIKEYKPSSVFESRYKLDNLMLLCKGIKQFKTKDEWDAEGLPFESKVKEVRQVRGETIPPKSYTLSQLGGVMAKKGMKSKQFINTYQKMYEANYMSYPRTEDDFVTPEQFNEMLPKVNTILELIGLPTGAFTHREPRKTHVKTGGSHGAIRPGLRIPSSLDALDNEFGKFASEIYKEASKRFLLMFLENTEWVRHEYETVDTPTPFKGSIKIITKQGVPEEDEESKNVATHLPDLSQNAKLYPHELKSHKPHATTTDWLMKQLDKSGVGTGATRMSTLSDMTGKDDKFPVKEGKILELSTMGWLGYHSVEGTTIGSVEGTKYLQDLLTAIKKGESPEEGYLKITEVIKNDVDKIRNMNFDLSQYNLPERVVGMWNGQKVTFNRTYYNHKFTDDEITMLLNGDEIIFETHDNKKQSVKIKGKLEEQEYQGTKFIGFKGVFMREGYVKGTWNGQEVTIKGSYMDHVFTQDELQTLFDGGDVDITTHKNDKTYNLTGKLEVQEYKGRKFVGYKAVFQQKEGYAKGTWNGKEISFKASYMDYKFTQDEIQKLLNGEELSIVTHKNDKTYNLKGKLAIQEYQGHKFVGFKAEFAPRDGYVKGVWKGKEVQFKGEWMKHKFTPDEIKSLLQDETIAFQGVSKSGNEMMVTGKLEEQSYQGRKFVGFKMQFRD